MTMDNIHGFSFCALGYFYIAFITITNKKEGKYEKEI